MADDLRYCRRCSSVLAADGACPTCERPRPGASTIPVALLILFFILSGVGVAVYFFFGPF